MAVNHFTRALIRWLTSLGWTVNWPEFRPRPVHYVGRIGFLASTICNQSPTCSWAIIVENNYSSSRHFTTFLSKMYSPAVLMSVTPAEHLRWHCAHLHCSTNMHKHGRGCCPVVTPWHKCLWLKIDNCDESSTVSRMREVWFSSWLIWKSIEIKSTWCKRRGCQ